MASQVHFVGTGPATRAEWLTKEAWDVIQRVDMALIVEDAWPPELSWPWSAPREYVSSQEVLGRLEFLSSQGQQIAVMVQQSPAHHPFMSSWITWAMNYDVMGSIIPGLWDMTVAFDLNGFCVTRSLEARYRGQSVLHLIGGEEPSPAGQTWHLSSTGEWYPDDYHGKMPYLTVMAGDPQPHFWLSRLPLYGRKILLLHEGVTARKASARLQELGATVYIGPVNQIVDPPSWTDCDQALNRIERYDWVIFTSQEAVIRFFQSLRRLGVDIRRARAQIAVVGSQTAALIRGYGLYPALMPSHEYSQEGLAKTFAAYSLLGTSILLPQGNLNRSYLQEYLGGRGAIVTTVQVYQNEPVALSPALVGRLERREVDAIFYTASSSVEHLIAQHPDLHSVLQRVPAISIGHLTTRTLLRYGIPVAAEPDHSSVEGMIEEVVRYFSTTF